MSYMSTHNRTRRVRGRANAYQCVECGQKAAEWALNLDSRGLLTDELGRTYSLDIFDYRPMCHHCHRIYDKSRITHCPQGHPYSGDNLLMDAGKRKCKTCVYARNRRRKPTAEQKKRRLELQRIRRAKARDAQRAAA